ncbi:MAG: hypothetical protein HOO96_38840 [Polyangiaceae bacterium]|nr:hypothetical protein [Polyangiaceae bacterium]
MSSESPAVAVRRQLALVRALVDELERQLARNEAHDSLRLQLADELRSLGEGLRPRPLHHASTSLASDLASLTAPPVASSLQPCA